MPTLNRSLSTLAADLTKLLEHPKCPPSLRASAGDLGHALSHHTTFDWPKQKRTAQDDVAVLRARFVRSLTSLLKRTDCPPEIYREVPPLVEMLETQLTLPANRYGQFRDRLSEARVLHEAGHILPLILKTDTRPTRPQRAGR